MARVAGDVPDWLVLPGDAGRQRRVLISAERAGHITERRPQDAAFCFENMARVLIDPQFVGQRSHGDRRRFEFVRRVGPERHLLVVAVKFLDVDAEAWVNSAYHGISLR